MSRIFQNKHDHNSRHRRPFSSLSFIPYLSLSLPFTIYLFEIKNKKKKS